MRIHHLKRSRDMLSRDFVDRAPRNNLKLMLILRLRGRTTAVSVGDRIAQLILERICTPDVVEVDDIEETDRGAGGFGSTGVASQLKENQKPSTE